MPKQLRDQVAGAETVTPELMSAVVAQAGIRLPALGASGGPTRLRRLIEAEAWTEAALALIELELPHWTLVRLIQDDGEWCCTLAKHPQLPDWLRESVESTHANRPLAILSAFVAARETSLSTPAGAPSSVRAFARGADGLFDALCCDNFS